MATPTAIFLGASNISAQVLSDLIDANKLTLTAIITHPDRPIGRHQILTPSPVAQLAAKHRLPLYKLGRLTTYPDHLPPPDYLITAAYGQLIPPHWLNLPRKQALNLHPSLLPAYRGSSPVPWAILDGAKQTGISLMQLDPKFDTGPLLGQIPYPLAPDSTTPDLLKTLFSLGTNLLLDYLSHRPNSHLYQKPKPQPRHSPTRYARKLTKQDGYIPFNQLKKALTGDSISAAKLDRLMRALRPWPGVWTKFHQRRLLLLNGQLNGQTYTLTKIQLAGKTPTEDNHLIQSLLH